LPVLAVLVRSQRRHSRPPAPGQQLPIPQHLAAHVYRSAIEHFFAASINIPARHRARLSRQNTGAGYAVMQSVFYVMVFAANALALLYFFQMFL
jgi:hypothetical protein